MDESVSVSEPGVEKARCFKCGRRAPLDDAGRLVNHKTCGASNPEAKKAPRCSGSGKLPAGVKRAAG